MFTKWFREGLTRRRTARKCRYVPEKVEIRTTLKKNAIRLIQSIDWCEAEGVDVRDLASLRIELSRFLSFAEHLAGRRGHLVTIQDLADARGISRASALRLNELNGIESIARVEGKPAELFAIPPCGASGSALRPRPVRMPSTLEIASKTA